MRRWFATCGLALACVMGALPVRAETLYALTQGSQLQEGCFPPCLCPVFIWEDLRGTFRLTPRKRDPVALFDEFDVSARGDWSLVRVWYPRIDDLGTASYPAHGFVHPGTTLASR